MTIPVQKTLTVTVDDALYQVDKMSPQVKDMIALMDEWRQKEVDLNVDLAMVRGALRDVQNQLLVSIRKDREEALERAKAMGVIPAANDQPTTGDISDDK
jgi:hypothetical protein